AGMIPLIFATSFGYMDSMLAVAKDFPAVKFEHCSGYKTAPNMSTYFGKIEEARYLSGIIAGKMTKAAKIGYVAATPLPEVVRGINAFALGVRSANPRAIVLVEWMDAWYDPAKERAAAAALLDAGADIIAQHSDTTEPQLEARERGKLSIGYDSDMSAFVGESVLASSVWNWEVYYADAIQRALDGTWSSRSYWGGLREGIVGLSAMSPRVPKDVVALVERTKKSIIGGKLDIFSGPIKGQDGQIKVEAKSALTDEQELTMDWFVQGVVGELD
ncbi:MAG: BMP family ABC transporter substrate-binding protein, partial [Spirochaetaceae bacterium]|nr:BMP family ABC transporter substrate-binding protein [Spirochaetaceae bacterium]